MNYNIVSLHLNRFKTSDDISNVLEQHNMQDLEVKDILELKKQGYVKLFIDKETHFLVAAVHSKNKKNIEFSKDFVSFLNNVPSLDWTRPKTVITIDELLDKINEKGIGSLSPHEKEILKRS